MQIELWQRTDEDGSTEEGIALYKRAALQEGEVTPAILGVKLGGTWYQSTEEAQTAGWTLQGYVALVTP